MKKIFFVLMMFACSFSFAQTMWQFQSGSSALEGKTFFVVTVHNETGSTLKIDGKYTVKDEEANFVTDSILISSSASGSKNFEAVYSIKNGRLDVTIGKMGKVSKKEETKTTQTVIVPPLGLWFVPPPPPRSPARVPAKEPPRQSAPKPAPTRPPEPQKKSPERPPKPQQSDNQQRNAPVRPPKP